jgi:hypothetical protein
VETHASDGDGKVAYVSYEEDSLVAIADAARDAFVRKIYKDQIRSRVDDFS